MRRKNVEECRPRCVRWFRAIGLTFTGTLLAAASSHAGVIDVSWTGPTKNTDRSSWADLALYRVYYSTSASPCPGSSFVQVAASTLSRSPNQTVSLQLTGLTTGSTYRVSVTTVDRDGKESECSAVASAVAEGDSAVTPTGPVSFGLVPIGRSPPPPRPRELRHGHHRELRHPDLHRAEHWYRHHRGHGLRTGPLQHRLRQSLHARDRRDCGRDRAVHPEEHCGREHERHIHWERRYAVAAREWHRQNRPGT